MKRLLSLSVALVMLLVLCVPAAAVSGAEETRTIYLKPNADTADASWSAYCVGKGNAYWMTKGEDGIYSVEIPLDEKIDRFEGAIGRVYYKVDSFDEGTEGNLCTMYDEHYQKDSNVLMTSFIYKGAWSTYGEEEVTTKTIYLKPNAETADAEWEAYDANDHVYPMTKGEDGFYSVEIPANEEIIHFEGMISNGYWDTDYYIIESFEGNEGNLCSMSDEWYQEDIGAGGIYSDNYFYTGTWSTYGEEEEVATKTIYFKPTAEFADAEWALMDEDSVPNPMTKGEDGIYTLDIPMDMVVRSFWLYDESNDHIYYVDKFVGTGDYYAMGAMYHSVDEDYPLYYYGATRGENGFAQSETHSNDVWVTYIAGGEPETVYSVSVSWGAMEFVYNTGSVGTWNPDTLRYEDAGEPGWEWSAESGNNAITVGNASNASVKASLSFAAAEGLDVTGAFMTAAAKGEGQAVAENTVTLASAAPAEGEEMGSKQSETVYFHITAGELDADAVEEGEVLKVGAITVTFTAVAGSGSGSGTDTGAATIQSVEIPEEPFWDTDEFCIVVTFDDLQKLADDTAEIRIVNDEEDVMDQFVINQNDWEYDYEANTATLRFDGYDRGLYLVEYRTHDGEDWIEGPEFSTSVWVPV